MRAMYPYRYIEGLTHAEGGTLLSLCCGIGRDLRRIPMDMPVTGVDVVPEYLAEFKQRYPQAETVLGDALEYILKVPGNSFDFVVCIDGVEHLTKENGSKLLGECQRVARNKAIIFTPEGFVKNEREHAWDIDGGDEHQQHLSGWEISEMERAGYRLVFQCPKISSLGQEYNESMYLYEKIS